MIRCLIQYVATMMRRQYNVVVYTAIYQWQGHHSFRPRPNKRLSKQSRGWWFETLSWSLWRHCNGNIILYLFIHSVRTYSISKHRLPMYVKKWFDAWRHHHISWEPITVISKYFSNTYHFTYTINSTLYLSKSHRSPITAPGGWTRHTMKTSLWRQNDVVTSFLRHKKEHYRMWETKGCP